MESLQSCYHEYNYNQVFNYEKNHKTESKHDTNSFVAAINEEIMKIFHAERTIYKSIDWCHDENTLYNYRMDILMSCDFEEIISLPSSPTLTSKREYAVMAL
ncbi:Hypothetical predicted protein [Octopus vulgaris]|uniref:Uncharacterized protein n=1 Tax=Octopus vulgaris TaxID=6645 RepID=A0AA36BN29_OCTVU|nr:Hypothetical predicted protein [Octopus vulgaris]